MLKLEFLFNSFVLFSLVHIQCLGSLLEYLFLSVFFQILLGSVQRNHTDKCNGCLSESCFWQFRKNTKVLFISNTGALISVKVFIVLNTQGDLPWEAQMCLVQTPLGKSNDSWGGCDPILCAHTGRAEQAKPALVVPVSASSKDWQGAHEHTTAVSQAAQYVWDALAHGTFLGLQLPEGTKAKLSYVVFFCSSCEVLCLVMSKRQADG